MGGQLTRENEDIIDDCVKILVVVSTNLNFKLSWRVASITSGNSGGGSGVGIGIADVEYRAVLRLAKGAYHILPTSRGRSNP
ncbi:MAG: hypothetical protein P8I97_13600 [Verrucomicrobiales bacterium]|nr:hypothetical protein [Verrucomicrobiales bacterium]